MKDVKEQGLLTPERTRAILLGVPRELPGEEILKALEALRPRFLRKRKGTEGGEFRCCRPVSAASSPSYQEGNLIVLRFAGNCCYPEVTECLDGVRVDLEAGTWSRNNPRFSGEETGKIGRGISSYRYSEGPIGVYDRTNIRHLTQMLNDWIQLYHISMDR